MSSLLVCVADYEEKAKKILEKSALDYYRSGAGDEYTLKLNKQAFNRLRILPRFLRDVSNINTECNIFGTILKWPFGVSPTAMQKLAHPDGEIANARAAGNTGCIFILSTLSTTSIEELAENAPNTHKWLQLYIYKNRLITENLIRRAENVGFKAIVLTIDAPLFGIRRSDVRNKFSLPSHLKLANFTGIQADGVISQGASGINEYVASQFDPTLTWKDVKWLVQFTKLPIILKGILTVEDALLAYHYGCKGIIVSNHGARQLDGVPASIEILPRITKVIGDKLIVMIDGGISQGTDMFKAIALGAKFVFMGRPALWGLAVNGQKGVEHVLNIVRKEFELTMALSGCRDLNEISSNMILHESELAKL